MFCLYGDSGVVTEQIQCLCQIIELAEQDKMLALLCYIQ